MNQTSKCTNILGGLQMVQQLRLKTMNLIYGTYPIRLQFSSLWSCSIDLCWCSIWHQCGRSLFSHKNDKQIVQTTKTKSTHLNDMENCFWNFLCQVRFTHQISTYDPAPKTLGVCFTFHVHGRQSHWFPICYIKGICISMFLNPPIGVCFANRWKRNIL